MRECCGLERLAMKTPLHGRMGTGLERNKGGPQEGPTRQMQVADTGN